MNDANRPLLTQGVTRLLVFNSAVAVLLGTVFVAPSFAARLIFDPTVFSTQPWSAFTYMAVHQSLVHFALTSVALAFIGPPVERRVGTRRFIAYYLSCGLGAALFSLIVSLFLTVPSFSGADGAIFGLFVAYAMTVPSSEIAIKPLGATISARGILVVMILVDLFFALWGKETIGHFSHLGGVATGYLFLRLQMVMARRASTPVSVSSRRPVVTPFRVKELSAELRPASPIVDRRMEHAAEEMDRVLEKISRQGIDSLTQQERKFLSDLAERKRREQS